MIKKIAFIGLGTMGYPMAGHLRNAGFEVAVYNRTKSKALQWVDEFSGEYADTPALAAQNADVVCLCVGNDDDVKSVTLGEHGVLSSMPAGTLLIDHTTTSAELAQTLFAQAMSKHVRFIDAPVSGGQAGAENGVLTIMAGGSEEDFTCAKPVFDAYARNFELLGPAGAGQLCKMVNQICIAGAVQGLSEGLAFAQKAGLDGTKVVKAISKGAAGSWQMDNRSDTMLNNQFDFGFAVDWMRKDLGYALEEARKNGAHLPITSLVDQFYSEVQALGGGRFDTSSLIHRLTHNTKR
ncbi:NAD(P)-dependent oxidoreductase [Pseudoalteromonas luteoviolacea]|uniref:NAD(P)-dependent oxidoreductase n=1 Tax=Pseudoalteromonas luteoviolacea TaxID=43657 RepID=UPI001B3A5C30|nr:NAD(P)-dependent oxidoreductase [Pseudoalteromonas luteoviolacea]MBQ4878195.1 NAD(P)-dependent oxidoreductase [Pseudoalteromonas luteoviolacea]MBQ4907350.1 NAD(P)-dependent oxidoreductase [Pseudoalteromonas luteoviolacea]